MKFLNLFKKKEVLVTRQEQLSSYSIEIYYVNGEFERHDWHGVSSMYMTDICKVIAPHGINYQTIDGKKHCVPWHQITKFSHEENIIY